MAGRRTRGDIPPRSPPLVLQLRAFDEDRVLVSGAEVLIGARGASRNHHVADRALVLGGDEEVVRSRGPGAVAQVDPVAAHHPGSDLYYLAAHAYGLPVERGAFGEDLFHRLAGRACEPFDLDLPGVRGGGVGGRRMDEARRHDGRGRERPGW